MPISKEAVQHELNKQGLHGWLLYDFRRRNDLACQFLEIADDAMLSRRFFYWIPADGEPVKIVSSIERHHLDHQPGKFIVYQTWKELEDALLLILQGQKRIAMEYSPRGGIPAVSKVDAGTVDLVREQGVEVVSSADLLQQFLCVWDEAKLATHQVTGGKQEQITCFLD